VALEDHNRDTVRCPLCEGSDIKEVPMSYAFKLLMDELKSMVIYPKLDVEDIA
jgi:DNA-directed RNA polymerase beta subunit